MATRKRVKSTSKWCKVEAKPSINGGDMIKRTYGVTQLIITGRIKCAQCQTVNMLRIGLERAFR